MCVGVFVCVSMCMSVSGAYKNFMDLIIKPSMMVKMLLEQRKHPQQQQQERQQQH